MLQTGPIKTLLISTFLSAFMFVSLMAKASDETLVVYKSPTCGCCSAWIDHLNENGIASSHEHPTNLEAVKDHYGVAEENRSCHTAVSKEGYVFEGHVPAKMVKAFLDNPPEGATGLAVPNMPMGSPGMEMDNRFSPYQVILMSSDGGSSIFAEIAEQSEQY